VLIKHARHLQFSYFDDKQDITKNYRGDEAQQKLDEILALPFSSIAVQTKEQDVQVQIPKDGKVIFHRSAPSHHQEPDLAHDMKKDLPLPADRPDAFLQTIGIMNEQGRVLPSMQDKFTQINEFLKLLEHTGELEHLRHSDGDPVNILDCGCGSSYLSFATYHYLNNIKGIPARLIGIDINEKLVKKSNQHSEELGFSDMCFYTSAIIDYQPDVSPDIVLALHACDRATDESLVQGILANARLILCVPCCHHHLHEQLRTKAPFQAIMQQGILKKRLADILTDTFRLLALRIMGYKTDIVEFVSSEHTDRNLMIRAVKRTKGSDKKAVQEYEELKQFWDVVPYIEQLLSEKQCWPGN
jgi:SAM-dependent methyltransferase